MRIVQFFFPSCPFFDGPPHAIRGTASRGDLWKAFSALLLTRRVYFTSPLKAAVRLFELFFPPLFELYFFFGVPLLLWPAKFRPIEPLSPNPPSVIFPIPAPPFFGTLHSNRRTVRFSYLLLFFEAFFFLDFQVVWAIRMTTPFGRLFFRDHFPFRGPRLSRFCFFQLPWVFFVRRRAFLSCSALLSIGFSAFGFFPLPYALGGSNLSRFFFFQILRIRTFYSFSPVSDPLPHNFLFFLALIFFLGHGFGLFFLPT